MSRARGLRARIKARGGGDAPTSPASSSLASARAALGTRHILTLGHAPSAYNGAAPPVPCYWDLETSRTHPAALFDAASPGNSGRQAAPSASPDEVSCKFLNFNILGKKTGPSGSPSPPYYRKNATCLLKRTIRVPGCRPRPGQSRGNKVNSLNLKKNFLPEAPTRNRKNSAHTLC